MYDLARRDETFDLVLFMGVFYHLRYPLLGLDIVCTTGPPADGLSDSHHARRRSVRTDTRPTASTTAIC